MKYSISTLRIGQTVQVGGDLHRVVGLFERYPAMHGQPCMMLENGRVCPLQEEAVFSGMHTAIQFDNRGLGLALVAGIDTAAAAYLRLRARYEPRRWWQFWRPKVVSIPHCLICTRKLDPSCARGLCCKPCVQTL